MNYQETSGPYKTNGELSIVSKPIAVTIFPSSDFNEDHSIKENTIYYKYRTICGIDDKADNSACCDITTVTASISIFDSSHKLFAIINREIPIIFSQSIKEFDTCVKELIVTYLRFMLQDGQTRYTVTSSDCNYLEVKEINTGIQFTIFDRGEKTTCEQLREICVEAYKDALERSYNNYIQCCSLQYNRDSDKSIQVACIF